MQKQGKLLKVRVERGFSVVRPDTKRGVIVGYSRRSRKRFLELIATIDWQRITRALFVTVTYPDRYVRRSVERRNRDKFLFLRRLNRITGITLCGLWRCEWKPRKTGLYVGEPLPHYHFLLFGCRWINKNALRHAWKRATGIEGVVCTDVKRAECASKAAIYAAKYCAKFADDPSLDYVPNLHSRGRQWGTVVRQLIPSCPIETVHDLSGFEEAWFAERGVELLPWRRDTDECGYSLIGDVAEEVWTDFLVRRVDANT